MSLDGTPAERAREIRRSASAAEASGRRGAVVAEVEAGAGVGLACAAGDAPGTGAA
jgi:hypothetical protein